MFVCFLLRLSLQADINMLTCLKIWLPMWKRITMEEFFPKPVPYLLLPLIEHRIKLLCMSDVTINPGVIHTSCIITEKSRKNSAKTQHAYASLRMSTIVFLVWALIRASREDCQLKWVILPTKRFDSLLAHPLHTLHWDLLALNDMYNV